MAADGGRSVLTERDRAIVGWLGRLGAAGAGEVGAHFGMGRTASYRRLAVCVQGGVLEAVRVLQGQPALFVATRDGLRWAGLDEFSVCRITAATAIHWAACARLAVWLERTEAGWVVHGERELRVAERRAGRTLASASIDGGMLAGAARLHRPDLLMVSRDRRRAVAVEVELSVKGAKRLEAIVRGWARCRGVEAVRYYAPPAVARAVSRAVEATFAQEMVDVRLLPRGILDKERIDDQSLGFAA